MEGQESGGGGRFSRSDCNYAGTPSLVDVARRGMDHRHRLSLLLRLSKQA